MCESDFNFLATFVILEALLVTFFLNLLPIFVVFKIFILFLTLNYQSNKLVTTISNVIKSDKQSLFVPDIQQTQQHINQHRDHQSTTSRVQAINDALILADVEFGAQQNNTNREQSKTYIAKRNDIESGWACYPKNKKRSHKMNLQSLTLLHTLFTRGNQQKNRRYTADRAQLLLYEEVASKDWFEQSLVTESRIKAFFGMSATNQLKLIREASAIAGEVSPSEAVITATTATLLTTVLEDAVEAVELEEEVERQNEFEIHSNVEDSTLNLSSEKTS